jgi:hypothetical protein
MAVFSSASSLRRSSPPGAAFGLTIFAPQKIGWHGVPENTVTSSF